MHIYFIHCKYKESGTVYDFAGFIPVSHKLNADNCDAWGKVVKDRVEAQYNITDALIVNFIYIGEETK